MERWYGKVKGRRRTGEIIVVYYVLQRWRWGTSCETLAFGMHTFFVDVLLYRAGRARYFESRFRFCSRPWTTNHFSGWDNTIHTTYRHQPPRH